MIKNYFKTAWRNLARHKGYSAINIAGLAIGVAASLLIFVVVAYEWSYDKFQKKLRQNISCGHRNPQQRWHCSTHILRQHHIYLMIAA